MYRQYHVHKSVIYLDKICNINDLIITTNTILGAAMCYRGKIISVEIFFFFFYKSRIYILIFIIADFMVVVNEFKLSRDNSVRKLFFVVFVASYQSDHNVLKNKESTSVEI